MTELQRLDSPVEVITIGSDRRVDAVRDLWLTTYRPGHTRDAYARDIAAWFGWCDRMQVDPLRVRRQHVGLFVREMEQTLVHGHPPAPSTVARAVSVVRQFYAYVFDENMIDANPVPSNKSLNLARVGSTSSTLGPDRDECRRILTAARARSPRDGAIVSVLLHEGLRVSELIGLNEQDISTSRGHRTITIHRKGGKIQTLALAPVAAADVENWLNARVAQGFLVGVVVPVVNAGAQTPTPLFVDPGGERITRYVVENIVTQTAKAAGVSKRLSPHSLRHACATQLLDEGVPIRDVQVYLGHADPKTTARYDLGREVLDRSPAYALSGIFG